MSVGHFTEVFQLSKCNKEDKYYRVTKELKGLKYYLSDSIKLLMFRLLN